MKKLLLAAFELVSGRSGYVLARALFAFVLCFLPALAFAQVVGPALPQPSSFGELLSGFLTPGGIAKGIASLGGIALGILGGFQFFTTKRKRILALAVNDAFHIVEDAYNELDDGTPAKAAFNKLDAGLKALDATLIANGWRPMRPEEAAAAKLALQATHGIEVAKEKIAVAAAGAAA